MYPIFILILKLFGFLGFQDVKEQGRAQFHSEWKYSLGSCFDLHNSNFGRRGVFLFFGWVLRWIEDTYEQGWEMYCTVPVQLVQYVLYCTVLSFFSTVHFLYKLQGYFYL